MSWDFSTEPEFQKKLDWVEEFCRNEIEPLDLVFPYAVRSKDPKIKALVKPLQDQVKAQGLWAIFLDKDLGGPGYGQLKLGLLNEILGRYGSAPQIFGSAAPDTGNMEMLAAYGTEEQKKRWLEPMLNQEIWSAYSMTEPQGGSDPKLFKTHALRVRDTWVINGEKWFTSAGRVADILFVMCTNGMFVVPRDTPGVEIMPEPRLHNHIKYNDVIVPADHLLESADVAVASECAEVVDATFFVEETVRELLDRGDLHQAEDRYVTTRPIDELEIPGTVQGDPGQYAYGYLL